MSYYEVDRDLDSLDPFVKIKVLDVLKDAEKAGLKVLVFETFRSSDRSNYLSRQGVGVVGGRSYHNYGLAVDIVFDKGGFSWGASDEEWQQLGAIGKSHGFEWGGDWKSRDMAHFQCTLGLSIDALLEGNMLKTETCAEFVRRVYDISRNPNNYMQWALRHKLCNDENWDKPFTKYESIVAMSRLEEMIDLKMTERYGG